MVCRRQRQRSIWETLLPDVAALWPADLRRIDTLLEDEAVLEPVVAALEARWPQSRRRGRRGTPAEVVLRMLLLKHLYRWSFDTLEYEVRTNLVFRAFARLGDGRVPDAKTILKIATVLGADVIGPVHARVVQLAVTAKVTRGRRLRVDTTVVETHIHYPSDSTLLRDATRVLTRTMQRVGGVLGGAAARVRNRLRSVGRRVLAIAQASRRETDRPQRARQYRRLMATARAVPEN
jgi:IS5 family transposase